MFFARMAFLTGAFNGAIRSGAHTAGLGIGAATLLSAANDKNDKKDGVERTMKSVAKLALMGML